MDSLPTGSVGSWLIVASVALTPLISFLLVDAIGRVRRRKPQARPEADRSGGTEAEEGGRRRGVAPPM
jgi:hypothetical protein